MDANEVKVIRWPKEKEKRALYRDLRVFRLLVVDPASPAPICTDSREDWIRAPIVRDDFNARLTSLRVKANNFRPHIDENQVLHFENRAVPLSPAEAELLNLLIRDFGSLVHRGALFESAAVDGTRSRNTLDLRIMRIRRRIAPLGLVLRTDRVRGYALKQAEIAAGA
ncbi:transcriptional regulator [Streptomyces sp. NWU339]|uniref:winged helix-turn-helix domain-containing protein n=1 Tax=Streptomyces sp. NWU339 TaxID=2185284 RepID=UPI000D677592|nr:winged helix-turn-helix domain-containing protein [Streptomyces sp. NWU339]PWI05416.1 transcriptional regulator [Streptomyces sp. NWU339]